MRSVFILTDCNDRIVSLHRTKEQAERAERRLHRKASMTHEYGTTVTEHPVER